MQTRMTEPTGSLSRPILRVVADNQLSKLMGNPPGTKLWVEGQAKNGEDGNLFPSPSQRVVGFGCPGDKESRGRKKVGPIDIIKDIDGVDRKDYY